MVADICEEMADGEAGDVGERARELADAADELIDKLRGPGPGRPRLGATTHQAIVVLKKRTAAVREALDAP